MLRTVSCVLLCALSLTLVGCASRSGSGAEAEAPPQVAIPADSPLAKIKPGMQSAEVVEILGEPGDKHSYESGKRWIPYYYGNDARREQWHYKGLGSVTFAAGNVFGGAGGEVVAVHYDPSDTGRRK